MQNRERCIKNVNKRKKKKSITEIHFLIILKNEAFFLYLIIYLFWASMCQKIKSSPETGVSGYLLIPDSTSPLLMN